ncbi:hypothetical protein BTVI_107127 [Pitangus sulphuratus]|nr:hypothetical protein BTVI_107127 [Pitangus sulphuratus]
MKFIKAKCKVLHLGQGNPKYKCSLSRQWIESSPEEEDVLVNEKLNMTHQQPAAQKANHDLGCIRRNVNSRSSEVILPLYSVLVRLYLEYCSQPQGPQHRKDVELLEQVQRRSQRWSEGCSTSALERG